MTPFQSKLPAGKISAQSFKKVLAGGKSYLPGKITKELRAAGLSDISGKKTLGRQAVLKAVKFLQKQRVIPKTSPPGEIFQKAAKIDEKKQAEIEARRQRHIKTQVKIDLEQEMATEDRGADSTRYDPRSSLGKLTDQLEAERQKRDKKIAEEKEKRDKLFHPPQTQIRRPSGESVFLEPPDLDIG